MVSERNTAPVCPGAAIGMPMTVSIEGVGTVKSVLIGIEHGQCLIVKLPLMPNIPLKFYEQNYFVVRYFHAGSAYGFRTTLIGIIKEPVRLFILDYPEIIESMNLRKHERYACLILAHASIHVSDADLLEMDGLILDISPKGCSFECKTSSDTKTENIAIGSVIDLSFRLSNENIMLMLPAEVRTFKIEHNKLMLGLKYELDPAIEAQQAAMDAILEFIVYL